MVNLEEEILVRKIVDEVRIMIARLGYKVDSISFDKNKDDDLEIKIIKK